MKISELNNLIVDFLRDNIDHPDPNHQAADNWIYMDYPRLDATFPRISVTQMGGSGETAGVGDQTSSTAQGQYHPMSYDIDVWVKKGNVYTISLAKKGGSALRDYLADLIISEIFGVKESYWKDDEGVIDITLDSITTAPFDEDTELFRKTLTFTFTILRDFTE
jgi:hypothetical protein